MAVYCGRWQLMLHSARTPSGPDYLPTPRALLLLQVRNRRWTHGNIVIADCCESEPCTTCKSEPPIHDSVFSFHVMKTASVLHLSRLPPAKIDICQMF